MVVLSPTCKVTVESLVFIAQFLSGRPFEINPETAFGIVMGRARFTFQPCELSDCLSALPSWPPPCSALPPRCGRSPLSARPRPSCRKTMAGPTRARASRRVSIKSATSSPCLSAAAMGLSSAAACRSTTRTRSTPNRSCAMAKSMCRLVRGLPVAQKRPA